MNGHSASLACLAALGLAACSASNGDTRAPVVNLSIQAEPEPAPPPAATDFTAGTFYAEWFFDHDDEGRSKLAAKKNAKTEVEWTWKLEHTAELLIKQDLDIVALTSVGGEREVRELAVYIGEHGGPDYDFAFVRGTDRISDQQVAILSKFPMYGGKRLEDVNVSKHLAAYVELPDDTTIMVVAAQLRPGQYASQKKARSLEARYLRKGVEKLRDEYDVLVLGDLGDPAVPDAQGYGNSAPSVVAGHNRKVVDDTCQDSAGWIEATETTVKLETRDRAIVCGLQPIDFSVEGEDDIIAGEVDPAKVPWSDVSADERDLSDHFLLRARIKLPSEADPESSPEPGSAVGPA